MLKTVLIVLVVLGVLTAIGAAWAKRSGYCSAENRIQFIAKRVGHKLDLNDDQQGRLELFAQKLGELRGDRQERRAAMKGNVTELLSAPSLDRERVVALMDEPIQSMGERKRALVDAFADFSDSLRPEQRTRLAELIGDRMMHRWGPPGWSH